MLFTLWLLALDPALLARAAEFEARADWAGASAVYAGALAVEADPSGRFELLLAVARLAAERQEYREARARLSQATSLASSGEERARALLLDGTLHLIHGRRSAARPVLERALALAETPSTRSASMLNLASVDLATGQRLAARRRLREALESGALTAHEQARGWITLSSIDGLEGDWPSAERCVRRAMAIEPSKEADWNLAAVLDHLGKGSEARRLRKGMAPLKPSAAIDVRALGLNQSTLVR